MRDFERTKAMRATLWVVQGLLAALYLFAGGMKLLTPVDTLTAQMHMPGMLMKFIGVCEVAGALGLILPGLLGVGRVLTPCRRRGLADHHGGRRSADGGANGRCAGRASARGGTPQRLRRLRTLAKGLAARRRAPPGDLSGSGAVLGRHAAEGRAAVRRCGSVLRGSRAVSPGCAEQESPGVRT